MTERQPETLAAGDYVELANLRCALRRFTDFSASEVQRLGLTPQQHQALLAIKGLPDPKQMSIGMLADCLLIAPQSATALVNKLHESKLVERIAADGRKQRLKLTLHAENILEQLSGAHLHEIRDMAPELMSGLRILQDRRKLEKIAWMA